MNFFSTRDNQKKTVTAAMAIKQGLASDGGLFVPEEIPTLTKEDVLALCGMTYPERAATILYLYLYDYTYE